MSILNVYLNTFVVVPRPKLGRVMHGPWAIYYCRENAAKE